MNKFIKIFISFLLILQGPALANPEPTPKQKRMAKYAFQTSLMDKVTISMRENIVFLKRNKECFEGIQHENCEEMKRDRLKVVERKFDNLHRYIFNYSLLMRAEMLTRLFRKQALARLKDDFDGRVYAWDHHQIFLKRWLNPLSNVEGITKVPSYKYTEDDIRYYLKDESRPLMIFDKEGTEVFLDPYRFNMNDSYKYMCNNFHRYYQTWAKHYNHQGKEKNPMCDRLTLQYSKARGGFHFPDAVYDDPPGDNSFMEAFGQYVLVMGAASVLADDLLTLFYASVTEAPHVALVQSKHPSDQEMVDVFNIMLKQAHKELKKAEKKKRKALAEMDRVEDEYEERITQFNKDMATWQDRVDRMEKRNAENPIPEPSRLRTQQSINVQKANRDRARAHLNAVKPRLEPVESNEKHALSFMSYGPMVEDLVQYPSHKMELLQGWDWYETMGEQMGAYGVMELKKAGWMLAGVLGAALICFIPISKIPKVATLLKAKMAGKAAKWNKPLCMPSVTVAVSWWFYRDTVNHYNQIYRRVFSTPEGSVLLTEIEQLEEAEFWIAMEYIMFLPVAYQGIKAAGPTLGKLSRGSRAYIQSLRAKHGGNIYRQSNELNVSDDLEPRSFIGGMREYPPDDIQ